jgi:hypothetical protein
MMVGDPQTPASDPPFVPIRRSGWPTRRMPRWAIVSGVVLLACGVAVGLAHRPTKGERASDFRGLLATMNTDIESCAGGVGDSLRVMNAIDDGSSHQLATAINLADLGSGNCSPANNMQLDDLTQLQVPESLDSYNLATAVNDLITWAAPDAINVQADVATVLSDRGKPGEAAAIKSLRLALAKLKAQRAVVYAALEPAIKALSPASKPPILWVTARPPNSY